MIVFPSTIMVILEENSNSLVILVTLLLRVLCCSAVTVSSVTPWTVARQAPLSMGFSRQEYWSGLPFPPPGDLPNPGSNTSYISCIGRQILCHCAPWEFFHVGIVLVFSGWNYKIPYVGWLEHLFLIVLEAGKSKMKMPANPGLGESSVLGLQVASFSLFYFL